MGNSDDHIFVNDYVAVRNMPLQLGTDLPDVGPVIRIMGAGRRQEIAGVVDQHEVPERRGIDNLHFA